MGHNHHAENGQRNIGIAFLLNFTFTIIEVIGGLWTNSVAILSDALHDFGDCISLGFAWYMQKVASRDSDATYNYGYRRFSVLGAFVTGLVLLVGLLFVVWNAVSRLLNPEPVNAPGMIVIAVIGIIFNGAAVLRTRKGTSLNEQVISWHLLEDVLGWVTILLGSFIMFFWDLPIVDPILSIFISLFILWNVIKNMRKIFLVFMQTAPRTFSLQQFSDELKAFENIKSAHNIQTWSIDGESHVLSAHVVVKSGTLRDEIVQIKHRIHNLLHEHQFEHVTLDVEVEGEDCAYIQH